MKKMKRLVAVLLAGVLALAMLTACGGGDSKSFAQQVEEAVMQSYNASVDENSKLQNDPTLRSRAMAMLDKIDENGMIATKDAIAIDYSMNGDKQVVTMILAANPNSTATNGKVPALEVTAADLEKLNKSNDTTGNLADDAEIEAVGVAAKTLSNGKTYVAVGVTLSEKTEG